MASFQAYERGTLEVVRQDQGLLVDFDLGQVLVLLPVVVWAYLFWVVLEMVGDLYHAILHYSRRPLMDAQDT